MEVVKDWSWCVLTRVCFLTWRVSDTCDDSQGKTLLYAGAKLTGDLGCCLSLLEQHLSYFLVVSKHFSIM